VSEQPWRNPRPAPQLPEMQPRLGSLLIPTWLRAWWPAVLWACFIFILSTDSFSSEHTGSIVEPILRWLFPAITRHQFEVVHHILRKSAHFTEYFVFCLLLFRAVRGARLGWHWSWGLTALAIAACYSCLDEVHQAFIASRTASPYDSLLDSIGAFFAFLALSAWFRFRRPAPPLPTPELS
jgi:VanZ family protein